MWRAAGLAVACAAAAAGAQQAPTVGPRFVAPDGTVSTIRRAGRRMEEGTDSVSVDAGTVLVARRIDTAGGLAVLHGVRHALRGDTLDIAERPPPHEAGGSQVRRLPPGAYLVRYRLDLGDGEDHLVVERRVVLR